jgi:hypothetical protein
MTKSYLRRAAIERQLIGGILEMTRDDKLFYRSDVGGRHEYSHWTDQGQAILVEFLSDMTRKLLTGQDAEFQEKVKQLTWKNLTKDEQ